MEVKITENLYKLQLKGDLIYKFTSNIFILALTDLPPGGDACGCKVKKKHLSAPLIYNHRLTLRAPSQVSYLTEQKILIL